MTVPTLKLHDGTTIPQLGFGVFQIPPQDTKRAVLQAFEFGYRHIDTAQMYQNEKGVGEAIAESGLSRDEIYVTTKLNNGFHRPDDARRAFDTTLRELGTDYVDLFLIHWPLPTLYDGDYVSTWKTLEEFKADGRARSIGVSNFAIHHLEELARETGLNPVAAGTFILSIALLMWALILFLRETSVATAALRIPETYLEREREL